MLGGGEIYHICSSCPTGAQRCTCTHIVISFANTAQIRAPIVKYDCWSDVNDISEWVPLKPIVFNFITTLKPRVTMRFNRWLAKALRSI